MSLDVLLWFELLTLAHSVHVAKHHKQLSIDKLVTHPRFVRSISFASPKQRLSDRIIPDLIILDKCDLLLLKLSLDPSFSASEAFTIATDVETFWISKAVGLYDLFTILSGSSIQVSVLITTGC